MRGQGWLLTTYSVRTEYTISQFSNWLFLDQNTPDLPRSSPYHLRSDLTSGCSKKILSGRLSKLRYECGSSCMTNAPRVRTDFFKTAPDRHKTILSWRIMTRDNSVTASSSRWVPRWGIYSAKLMTKQGEGRWKFDIRLMFAFSVWWWKHLQVSDSPRKGV